MGGQRAKSALRVEARKSSDDLVRLKVGCCLHYTCASSVDTWVGWFWNWKKHRKAAEDVETLMFHDRNVNILLRER